MSQEQKATNQTGLICPVCGREYSSAEGRYCTVDGTELVPLQSFRANGPSGQTALSPRSVARGTGLLVAAAALLAVSLLLMAVWPLVGWRLRIISPLALTFWPVFIGWCLGVLGVIHRQGGAGPACGYAWPGILSVGIFVATTGYLYVGGILVRFLTRTGQVDWRTGLAVLDTPAVLVGLIGIGLAIAGLILPNRDRLLAAFGLLLNLVRCFWLCMFLARVIGMLVR